MENLLSYIPLDIALIAENFDRFLYGAWVTLNLPLAAVGRLAVDPHGHRARVETPGL